MTLAEVVEKLGLDVKTGSQRLDVLVNRGYVSDLMSDVMANAREGDLWVTLQIHQNIVAVAVMKSLSGIILVNGREPQEETLRKAASEQIPVLVSSMPAFELVGQLYQLGLSGN
jgi:predicted transcriptional regulator